MILRDLIRPDWEDPGFFQRRPLASLTRREEEVHIQINEAKAIRNRMLAGDFNILDQAIFAMENPQPRPRKEVPEELATTPDEPLFPLLADFVAKIRKSSSRTNPFVLNPIREKLPFPEFRPGGIFANRAKPHFGGALHA